MPSISQHIPFARSVKTGALVKPYQANRQADKGLYECLDPKCKRPVLVSSSKHHRVHFRHYRGDIGEQCGFSGISRPQNIHTKAKLHVAILFENALLKKAPMPKLRFDTPEGIHHVLPFIVNCKVKKEWDCKAINRRIDIAIVDQDETPVLLIEIKYKHAVNYEKREALKSYWWIEVDAKDILVNPHELIVRTHGNFPYEYELLGNQSSLF